MVVASDRPRRLGRGARVAIWFLACVVVLVAAVAVAVEAGMYRPDDAQPARLAITGAQALVGSELEPRRDVTVLIEDGRIVDVVEAGAPLPHGVAVVDALGSTLLPGLIDLHVHLGTPPLEAGQEPGLMARPRMILELARHAPGARRDLLAHGVTTVRTVGDDLDWITVVRRQLRDHELEGPRVLMAGPVITTVGGHPVATIHDGQVDEGSVRLPTTPEDAQEIVRQLATGPEAVDVIKVIHDRGDDQRPLDPLPGEVLRAVVATANQHGLPVIGHWSNQQDMVELLDAGVDGLEHLESRDVLDGWPDLLLDLLVDTRVSVTSTLAVTEAALPPEVVQRLAPRAQELHAAGGVIVLGTDAGMPGVAFGSSVHRELELLVSGGMTPTEALLAATSRAADALRRDDVGVIEPGRAADLLLVAGDPLANITDVRHVLMVLRDGRVVVDNRDNPPW